MKRFVSVGFGRCLWRSSRVWTVITVVLSLVAGVAPATVMLATGNLVAAVDSRGSGSLVAALAWFAAAALLVAVVSAARSIACQQLSARYVPLVERRLTAAALRPRRLDRLEDPLVAARLAAASDAGREGVHLMAVDSFSSIVQARTVGVASLVILASWSWWPPLALLAGYLLVGDRYRRWQETRFGELLVVSGGERRRAEYFRRLLVDASPAAEVRVLGLSRWLSDRYASTWRQAMLPVWRTRRHAGGPLTVGLVVLMVVNGAIVAALARGGFTGAITVAALTVYLQALATAFRLGILGDVTWLYARAASTVAFIDDLDRDLTDPAPPTRGGDARPARSSAATRPVTAEAAGSVRLERVTFCYPTVDRPSVEEVSVTIPAGQSVAIVGRNGAGKSTLVKLLCGLYAPTHGSLLVGGVDTRSEASGASGVAAIFQTFTHVETTLADSIALGAPGVPVTRERLETALDDAGGASLLEDGVGWDTMLSAAYDGGRDLSGGQWQRVALARALYAMHAGAQVLVLDEPTAAMDIHAETALFARFREVCRGTTTVLVTHRLATVRHVDRILVLERGRLVEDGSHHDLIERGRCLRADVHAAGSPVRPSDGVMSALRDGLRDGARGTWLLVRTGIETSPVGAVLSLLEVVGAVITTLGMIAVAQMATGIEHHAATQVILAAVIIAAATSLSFAFLLIGGTARSGMRENVGFTFDKRIADLVARTPTLDVHEDQTIADDLQILRQNSNVLGVAINTLINTVIGLVDTVIFVIAVSIVQPRMLLLCLAALPPLLTTRWQSRWNQAADAASARPGRQAQHFSRLATDPTAAAEIRVFGLQEQILHRTYRANRDWRRPIAAARSKAVVVHLLEDVVTLVILIAVLGWLLDDAAHGRIPVGDVVLVAYTGAAVAGQVSATLSSTGRLSDAVRTANRLLRLEARLDAATTTAGTGVVPPAVLTDGVSLDTVSFTHANETGAAALTDVTLTLPAASTIAIVGDNGAGKTTLVRLLFALYQPSAGTISVDGRDLAEIDVDAWRSALAYAGQEPTRFELTAAHSIGIGDLAQIDNTHQIQTALTAADAADLIDGLPDGLATQLGTRWVSGVDLSGGQWLKIALARTNMRSTPLLTVLDEPTAALDAYGEQAVFGNAHTLARAAGAQRGGLTVLVTHRAASASIADHIIALDHGRIVEHGSHDHLITNNPTGPYATRYHLEAAGYTPDDPRPAADQEEH